MILCYIMSSISFTLSISLIMLCSMISKKSFLDQQKLSPFECGFDPKSSSRLPFSLRFFIISIIFLIFDIEISILLPVGINLPYSNIKFWTLTTMLFLMMVMLGLYYEWKEGALQWK